MNFNIEVRLQPAQHFISRCCYVTVADLLPCIEATLAEMHTALALEGLVAAGAPWGIYRGDISESADGPIEICLPFVGKAAECVGFDVKFQPAVQGAVIAVSGDAAAYPQVIEAYQQGKRWLDEQGRMIIDDAREVWLSDDVQVLEIIWPFE
ncbi:hypothetical protein ABHF33_06535 [Chitinibacter sp. FCG-7]|uniref:GyrI-like domain-containing protein n=1 Tax=Chitinibacter mangrovi TaxID=3153927 RepID=A0AAU7FCW1_9NEIS